MNMNKNTCVIEMYPPSVEEMTLAEKRARYEASFQRVIADGFFASIPDNAMGTPLPGAKTLIEELDLPIGEGQVIVHLITYHEKEELHKILQFCREKNIDKLLIMTGDGSDAFHRLTGEELEAPEMKFATSVELLRYIKKYYPGFQCGVAYDLYKPEQEERAKLKRKIAAGADFVITQPVLSKNVVLARLLSEEPALPILLGSWMSKNEALLEIITGQRIPEGMPKDGYERLEKIRAMYPGCGSYLSLLSFENQYPKLPSLFEKEK